MLLAEVSGIDVERRRVTFTDAATLDYDYLIVATGARHSYFGHDEWEPLAPGLKSLEDALDIRRRVLLAFERAERETDTVRRHAYLTFVIVGGGPTGVEMAGAVAEIRRYALRRDFRHIDPGEATVMLLEGGPRLLPVLPASLSDEAKRDLRRLGVEVRTETMRDRHPAGPGERRRMDDPHPDRHLGGRQHREPAAAMRSTPRSTASAARSSSPTAPSPGIPRCSCWAMRPRSTIRRAARCPGLCPVAIQMGEYTARTIAAISPDGRARPSDTGTRASSRSSAADRRWRTSGGSTSAASSPGWPGSSSTSSS